MLNTGEDILISGQKLLGYTTGAGGAVTQDTDKSTGVTLNAPTGQITMHSAELAGAAVATFVLTNSFITATDNVVITANFAGGPYEAWAYSVGAGQCSIAVRNASGGALSNAVVLNFAVINGAGA
jgi:hypothetical protein